jgi:AcrR family transcriptional regulator
MATQRMPRAQRREQILDAATRAFARAGYTATKLEDIAAEAGITQVILYRHFESKSDLYRAVLDRAMTRLDEKVGVDEFDDGSTPALLRAAAEDPDGYRLVFRHAAREPEFRELTDRYRDDSAEITSRLLADRIPDKAWLDWTARLLPTFVHDAVIAWLDAGQPDPDDAARKITHAVEAIISAAQGTPS